MTRVTGPGWEMRLGDCIAGMRELADDSVDVVITDPPYEAEAHSKGRRTKTTNWRTAKGRADGSDARVAMEAPLPFAAITESQRAAVALEIARTARRWSLVFCQVEASQAWAQALSKAGLDYVRTMIWVKPDGQPQFTGDRPGVGYESIVVAHRPGRKRWNGGGRVGVFEFSKNARPGSHDPSPHPTTKPQPLMRELVSLFSEPGELVLDMFAGSGSTGVACGRLGRQFLGFELAACAKCTATAQWDCSWFNTKGDERTAYLCDAHRDEVMALPGAKSHRDNYFDIACRRLRGDEAKPNPAQPSLFGDAA